MAIFGRLKELILGRLPKILERRRYMMIYPGQNHNEERLLRRLQQRYENQFAAGNRVYFTVAEFLQLAASYEEEGMPKKGIEAIAQGVAQHPFAIDLHLKLAQLYLDNHFFDKAFDTLAKARGLAPGDIEVELLYAEALIAAGDVSEAMVLLDFLKDGAGSSSLSDILFIEALAHERNDAYEAMFYTLQQSVVADPENQEALERFGSCTLQCRKYTEGIAFYEQLLEQNAYLPVAWYNLAQAKVYMAEYEEAVEAYEYAIAVDDQYWQACRDCADLCMELQHFQKALKYYLQLLEAQGSEAEAELYVQIGQCYLQLDRPSAAITFYIRSAQMDPLNDEIYFAIGECYAAQGQWMNAVQYFEKTLGIDDTREEYLGALAEAYYNLGNTDMAVEYIREAIALNDIEARYWILYATFLIDAGQAEEALDVLEEAMDTAPGAEVLYCRVACLFATGKRNAAMYWLGEALTEDFEMHRSLFELMPELETDASVINLIADHTWQSPNY